MRNHCFSKIRPNAFLLVIFFQFCFLQLVQAQYCSDRKVPKMWDKKKDGDERRDYFMQHKYQKFCDAIGGKRDVSTFFYTREDFSSMIDHFQSIAGARLLRVFLASYTAEVSAVVPHDHNELMTLIFSPCDEAGKVIADNYYTLSPLPVSDPAYRRFNATDSKLSSDVKDAFIAYYVDKKLPELTKMIDDNNDNRHMGKKSETRSILFDLSYMNELKEEMACQNASGIIAEFGSYTNKGKLKPDETYGFKKRIMIQWQLTQKEGLRDEVFYIEHRAGFGGRTIQMPQEETLIKSEKISKKLITYMLNFNNGQLCPPNCPDDGR